MGSLEGLDQGLKENRLVREFWKSSIDYDYSYYIRYFLSLNLKLTYLSILSFLYFILFINSIANN